MVTLSVPLPDDRRCSCQKATPATTSRPTSAPAWTVPGSAPRRAREARSAVCDPVPRSAGAMTASAQASATIPETSQAAPGSPSPSEVPVLAIAPVPPSSRMTGPASSGAAITAGSASSSASPAASHATRSREPPRARSSAVSPARSSARSWATSSRAKAARMTSCRAPISSVERVTSRLRRSASSRSGSPLDAWAAVVAGSSLKAATVCRTSFSRRSIEPVVAVRKSPDACQATLSAATRPEPKVPSATSIGP